MSMSREEQLTHRALQRLPKELAQTNELLEKLVASLRPLEKQLSNIAAAVGELRR